MVEGPIAPNGLAWNEDGRTMFHSELKGQVTWACDHDPATGTIGNRREVTRPSGTAGRPDGSATDAGGCHRSAGIPAAALNRWAPDGRVDR